MYICAQPVFWLLETGKVWYDEFLDNANYVHVFSIQMKIFLDPTEVDETLKMRNT